MGIGNRLSTMDFARVVSVKSLKKHGFNFGDEVMVTGFKPVPFLSKDPYLVKNYGIVAKVKDDVVQIPDESNDYMVYIVDLTNFEKVSDERREELTTRLSQKHG